MATAEELLVNELGNINNLWFEIDLLARQIVIPKAVTNLGARGDEDVMHACFRLPRFYYDIDFADFKIGIDYTNAQGEEDRYEPKDVVIDDDVVTFTWVVGRHAALYEGTVTFGLCAKRLNPDDPNDPLNEFHTRKASLPILDSMETCEEAIIMHTDLLEQWRRELFDREESVTAAEAIVSYSPPTDPEAKIWINPSGTAGVAATSTETKNISSVSNIVGLALNEVLNSTAARYTTIEDALAGASATADGNVLAYTCGGEFNIMLLADIESATTINVTKDCTIHLNGKRLSFTAAGAYLNINTASKVTIDGEVTGSEITKNLNVTTTEMLVRAAGTKVTVLGGLYTVYGSYGTVGVFITSASDEPLVLKRCKILQDISGAAFAVSASSPVEVYQCDIDVSTTDKNIAGIAEFAAQNVTATDSTIKVKSHGLKTEVLGIKLVNGATSTITNCRIEADGFSDVTNEDGTVTAYNVYPVAGFVGTSLVINGGYYWGARDALLFHGTEARINGGVYEGCQHGGAYMCGTDIKAKNAIFRNVPYKGVVGWLDGQGYGGALYCGSVDETVDVNVYFDNCRFESARQATNGIVAKNTNTEVFLSNCVIDGDFTNDLRADATCAIYIGKNVVYDANKTTGTIDTTTYADQEFGFDTETTMSNALLAVKDERGNWVGIPSSTPASGNSDAVAYTPQTRTDEQKAQARKNIGAVSRNDITDQDQHAEYFTITEDGVLSLKPEYRGAASKADNINDVSDMGVGKVGSKNAELPKHLFIPEIVDGKAVLGLAVAIFQYNDALENVTLPCTITELPKYCFSYCHYLKNVYNTENIKSIGLAAFQRADISRANFPKLEQFAGVAPFVQCRHLVYADIGKVAEIPQSAFDTCAKLNMVKSESAFTSAGKRSFFKTPNLKHADFSGLKNIGEAAFLRSGVDCDWSALTDCTFGANATPLQYSPTDYWSACTFTPCENRLPTHLSQSDDRWGDRQIGTSGKTYSSNGCAFFTIMHTYCGLRNLALSTVEEMEAVINGIDPNWLNSFSANTHDIGPQAEKLGLKYERFFTFDQANLQALYDALAAGKYGMVVYDEPNLSAHIVVVYGINAKGELLVADSSHAYWSDGEREPMKYALPIYKLCDQITMGNNYDLHIISL